MHYATPACKIYTERERAKTKYGICVMIMNNFVPYIFIGIGETGAFFTLRQTYIHTAQVSGCLHREVRSYHHFNLGQDADQAFRKATEFAHQHAIKLETSLEELKDEMRKIHRATAEEMARREQEEQQRREAWAAERAIEDQRKRDMIQSGMFPFGTYEGKAFSEAPRGYLTWLSDSVNIFDDGSLLQFLAQEVFKQCTHLIFPKPAKHLTIGNVGQRLELDVLVIKCRYFDRDVFNTYDGRQERVYVITLIDKATDACLFYKGTTFKANEGDEIRIRATIKHYAEYKGNMQTVLQRVKPI